MIWQYSLTIFLVCAALRQVTLRLDSPYPSIITGWTYATVAITISGAASLLVAAIALIWWI